MTKTSNSHPLQLGDSSLTIHIYADPLSQLESACGSACETRETCLGLYTVVGTFCCRIRECLHSCMHVGCSLWLQCLWHRHQRLFSSHSHCHLPLKSCMIYSSNTYDDWAISSLIPKSHTGFGYEARPYHAWTTPTMVTSNMILM